MGLHDELKKAKQNLERFRYVKEVIGALVYAYAESHSREDLISQLSKLPDICPEVLRYVQTEEEKKAASMFVDFLMLQIRYDNCISFLGIPE